MLVLASVLGVVLVGCTLTVDVDRLANGECPEGHKPCDARCSPLNSPMVGCAAASCSPCALPNAIAVCSASGMCAIATCLRGHEDCDGEVENGCEADLDFGPLTCGGCGRVCEVSNAESDCAGGRCAVRVCDDGYADCNDAPGDGCERDVTTVDDCGECDWVCEAGQACVAGQCE